MTGWFCVGAQEHRVGGLTVTACIAVEADRAETGRDAAIGPDAQILAGAVLERHRPLTQAESDIDGILLVRAFLAAGPAQPLAAFAAGLAGKAPEFEQVHTDPLGAVAEMDGAPGWLLHVNPFKPPTRGRDVVVYKSDKAVLIKQFLRWEGDALVLRRLNPEQELRVPRAEVSECHLVVGVDQEG